MSDDVEQITGEDMDPYGFHSDGDEEGLVVTQHRFYRWGDIVIAVGELNFPNQWDDEAFEAKCEALVAALTSEKQA